MDYSPSVTPSLSLAHLDVLVVGVSEQWIGQARTVSPPAVVDLHHHAAQSGRPLFQKLLPYCLQIAHEEFQDAAVLHVSEQERMHFLMLCENKQTNQHQLIRSSFKA